jgi:hypothetical protein
MAKWFGFRPKDVDRMKIMDFNRLRAGIDDDIKQQQAAARDRG